jgi:hypothetical protein
MKTGTASQLLWVRYMSMRCVQLLRTYIKQIKGYSVSFPEIGSPSDARISLFFLNLSNGCGAI